MLWFSRCTSFRILSVLSPPSRTPTYFFYPHYPRQRQECDFEGFPSPTPNPLSSRLSFPDGQCHIAFTGLERTGHDLSSLRVTAHFGVDSIHKVGEGTGPVKASLIERSDPQITMALHVFLLQYVRMVLFWASSTCLAGTISTISLMFHFRTCTHTYTHALQTIRASMSVCLHMSQREITTAATAAHLPLELSRSRVLLSTFYSIILLGL